MHKLSTTPAITKRGPLRMNYISIVLKIFWRQPELIKAPQTIVPGFINKIHYFVRNHTELWYRSGKPWQHVCISAWVGKSVKKNAQSFNPIGHDPVVAPYLVWNLQNFCEMVNVVFQKSKF